MLIRIALNSRKEKDGLVYLFLPRDYAKFFYWFFIARLMIDFVKLLFEF